MLARFCRCKNTRWLWKTKHSSPGVGWVVPLLQWWSEVRYCTRKVTAQVNGWPISSGRSSILVWLLLVGMAKESEIGVISSSESSMGVFYKYHIARPYLYIFECLDAEIFIREYLNSLIGRVFDCGKCLLFHIRGVGWYNSMECSFWAGLESWVNK